MGAAIAIWGGSNYRAETPRRRTALAVLLVHILLLLLLLTLQPPVPVLPPLRVEANQISIRPIEEPVVVPLDPERAVPTTRESEVQRPLPDAPQRPSPFERRATDAPGNPAPEAGSPAPMQSPIPMPNATPALGQSAILGTGGTTDGSGTGAAGTGGTGAGGRGGGAGAGGGGGGGGGAAGIATARWAFMMRYERLLSFYPREARRARINGRVTLVCRVRLNQTVHGCEVEQESPGGMGFGAAAIRASREFRVHPRRVAGREVNDGLVSIPIRFEVPDITSASN